ncbi:Hypothetical protein NTJ_13087 [Nesidiocoris tenuis]|uniref:CUB domain-containing protein n=1 Tax=Nesidiocoris tenuis TaxID=355587 RepID=A0ABN7B7A0_9HEMI|nr:Hypothetical protein NTJ_13087 [Nesidiocoris tenuis]
MDGCHRLPTNYNESQRVTSYLRRLSCTFVAIRQWRTTSSRRGALTMEKNPQSDNDTDLFCCDPLEARDWPDGGCERGLLVEKGKKYRWGRTCTYMLIATSRSGNQISQT